jgi:general nucleoside transport system permease protein
MTLMDPNLFFINLLAAGICRGTPLLFATIGEIVTERAGIMNLGLEGMMLTGAMSGFGLSVLTGNMVIGLAGAMIAVGMLSLIHGFVAISLQGDQVVSGLALTFFGTGLASVVGAPLVELQNPVSTFSVVAIPILGDIPFIGPVFFRQNFLVYLGYLLIPFSWYFLFRTRRGLNLRACGENPSAAHAMGIPVNRVRYWAVFAGGALSGLAGASLSLAITPGWVEGMTAGQGWIAVGLVIFAGWNPWRAAAGAYLFGAIRRLPLDLQGVSWLPLFSNPNSGYFLGMLPYLFCIAALVLSSRRSIRLRQGAPAALGQPFTGEMR